MLSAQPRSHACSRITGPANQLTDAAGSRPPPLSRPRRVWGTVASSSGAIVNCTFGGERARGDDEAEGRASARRPWGVKGSRVRIRRAIGPYHGSPRADDVRCANVDLNAAFSMLKHFVCKFSHQCWR